MMPESRSRADLRRAIKSRTSEHVDQLEVHNESTSETLATGLTTYNHASEATRGRVRVCSVEFFFCTDAQCDTREFLCTALVELMVTVKSHTHGCDTSFSSVQAMSWSVTSMTQLDHRFFKKKRVLVVGCNLQCLFKLSLHYTFKIKLSFSLPNKILRFEIF